MISLLRFKDDGQSAFPEGKHNEINYAILGIHHS